MTGDFQDNQLFGLGGNDELRGGADNSGDSLWGGSGDDRIWGGGGNDQIGGGAGNDVLRGQTGDDIIWGGDGRDTIDGGYGSDTLQGGNDTDNIFGGSGDDILRGGPDGWRDDLWGGAGNDVIWGGAGNDTILGGANADHIYGGSGTDWLYGEGQADTFHYRKGYEVDRIKDFQDDVDTINLGGWGFASVSAALAHATQQGAHVQFDFTGISGASPNDVLWVENITISALADDIVV